MHVAGVQCVKGDGGVHAVCRGDAGMQSACRGDVDVQCVEVMLVCRGDAGVQCVEVIAALCAVCRDDAV